MGSVCFNRWLYGKWKVSYTNIHTVIVVYSMNTYTNHVCLLSICSKIDFFCCPIVRRIFSHSLPVVGGCWCIVYCIHSRMDYFILDLVYVDGHSLLLVSWCCVCSTFNGQSGSYRPIWCLLRCCHWCISKSPRFSFYQFHLSPSLFTTPLLPLSLTVPSLNFTPCISPPHPLNFYSHCSPFQFDVLYHFPFGSR